MYTFILDEDGEYLIKDENGKIVGQINYYQDALKIQALLSQDKPAAPTYSKNCPLLGGCPSDDDCVCRTIIPAAPTDKETLTVASAPADQRASIREIFLANGFTIKPSETDLKPYVYAAAEEVARAAVAADRAGRGLPVELQGVAETVAGGGGFWHSCSGCHETEDGHPVGNYPYSEALKCALGSGCDECGGIGAVWDNTDYDRMGTDIEAEDARATLTQQKGS